LSPFGSSNQPLPHIPISSSSKVHWFKKKKKKKEGKKELKILGKK
jgi:hypothetical protein